MIQTLLDFYNGGGIGGWVAAISAVLLASKGITMLTPTKIDNMVVDKILWFLNNVTSLNIGGDKNKDA